MSDRPKTSPSQHPLPRKGDKPRVTAIEIVALALTVLWLVGTVLFFVVLAPSGMFEQSGGALQFVIMLLAIFMPVAVIWVGAVAARASQIMREESQRLQTAIDAIRNAYVQQAQASSTTVTEPSVAKKLDEIAAAQRKTETALATFSTSRQPEPPRPAPAPAPVATGDQVVLPLGTTAEYMQPPLETDDFIKALNFPENAQDKAGFAALRRALKHRPTAQLVQAAQDILTLMSQDGIYMDDLKPDRARPEIWRRFAAGERGGAIAPLGGIRDRSSLALTAARMKQDPIYRDATHHFLRLFDRTISAFAETATDAELSEFSDTRTARAFMLLGRVAGTFH